MHLPDHQEIGHVASVSACQSYTVSTPSENFRRYRRHINPLPEPGDPVTKTSTTGEMTIPTTQKQPPQVVEQPPVQSPNISSPQQQPNQTTTQSGRVSHPPDRFIYGGKRTGTSYWSCDHG